MPVRDRAKPTAPAIRGTDSSFAPLRIQRTFEVIVDQIKDRIFSGEYRPGDRLPSEREFAEILEVGRPAVREAYRALELIGIVEIRKGKQGGAFISARDHRTVTETLGDLIRLRRISIADLTEARLVLEKDIAELALRRVRPKDIAQLRGCVENAIAKSNSGIAASEENVRFHVLLGEMSGNPILAMMIASIMDLLLVVIRAVSPGPEESLDTAEHHHLIVDALQAGDFEKLWPILEEHIHCSNGKLVKAGKRSPFLRPAARDGDRRGSKQSSQPRRDAPRLV